MFEYVQCISLESPPSLRYSGFSINEINLKILSWRMLHCGVSLVEVDSVSCLWSPQIRRLSIFCILNFNKYRCIRCRDRHCLCADRHCRYVGRPRRFADRPRRFTEGPRRFADGHRRFADGPRRFTDKPHTFTEDLADAQNDIADIADSQTNIAD